MIFISKVYILMPLVYTQVLVMGDHFIPVTRDFVMTLLNFVLLPRSVFNLLRRCGYGKLHQIQHQRLVEDADGI